MQKITVRSLRRFNLLITMLLFIGFLSFTILRCERSTLFYAVSLPISSQPFQDEIIRSIDPIKDMKDAVEKKAISKEVLEKTPEELKREEGFNYFAKKILIPKKNISYEFQFVSKKSLEAELTFEVYNAKKEFLFLFYGDYQNDKSQEFYVEFPESGEYYIVAAIPYSLEGKINLTLYNELNRSMSGVVDLIILKDAKPYLNLIFPAILFGILFIILFLVYRRAEGFDDNDTLYASLVGTLKHLKALPKKIASLFIYIFQNPFLSFKKLIILSPFLLGIFFLLLHFKLFETVLLKDSLFISPVSFTELDVSYLKHYAKKIRVDEPKKTYELSLNINDWGLDDPSGKLILEILNTERKSLKTFQAIFYYEEYCCDSEGDDTTRKNTSEKYFYQFPEAGEYYISSFLLHSNLNRVDVAAYNLFQDNTNGMVDLKLTTNSNYGEKPFKGIFIAVAIFLWIIGAFGLTMQKNWHNYNFIVYFLLMGLLSYVFYSISIPLEKISLSIFIAGIILLLWLWFLFVGAKGVLNGLIIIIGLMLIIIPVSITYGIIIILFYLSPVLVVVFLIIGYLDHDFSSYLQAIYFLIYFVLGIILKKTKKIKKFNSLYKRILSFTIKKRF